MDGNLLKVFGRRKKAAFFYGQQKTKGISLLSVLFGKSGNRERVQALKAG